MLELKDGAVVAGNQYTRTIMTAVQLVYNAHQWLVTITSGRDSHTTGYHPLDRALDIRVAMIPEEARLGVLQEIKAHLPKYYDCVYEKELVEHGVIVKGAHFHLEADEKKELNSHIKEAA